MTCADTNQVVALWADCFVSALSLLTSQPQGGAAPLDPPPSPGGRVQGEDPEPSRDGLAGERPGSPRDVIRDHLPTAPEARRGASRPPGPLLRCPRALRPLEPVLGRFGQPPPLPYWKSPRTTRRTPCGEHGEPRSGASCGGGAGAGQSPSHGPARMRRSRARHPRRRRGKAPLPADRHQRRATQQGQQRARYRSGPEQDEPCSQAAPGAPTLPAWLLAVQLHQAEALRLRGSW